MTAHLLLLALLVATPIAAQEKTKVVTTLPHLGAVAREIGGELVEVVVLAAPGGDPHELRVSTGMIAKLEDARVFIENGMALESWTPRLLERAGSRRLSPEGRGHGYASNGIVALERPDAATLAGGGHVHAAGNPHVWLDPINLVVVARNIEAVLLKEMPLARESIAIRRQSFEKRLHEATFGKELLKLLGGKRLEKLHRTGGLWKFLREKSYRGKPLIERAGGWYGRARDLQAKRLVSFHKTWSYLERAFDLEVVGTLEEKPGIPPTPAHLAKLEAKARTQGVRAVIAPPYYPASRIEGFAERLEAKALVLPTQPGEAGAPEDVFGLFDRIFDLLETAR